MDTKTRHQIAKVLLAAADALDGGTAVVAQHKVGQKVWYDGRPAVVKKVGLKGPFGDDSIEIQIDGTTTTIKTGPLDHRLTEKKGQKKPTLDELMWGRKK